MTWSPTPRQPKTSLPARLRAGDALSTIVQTKLALGSSVFYTLTAVIDGKPTRITLGGSGVAVDATGKAAFSSASSVTGAWAPGLYQWVCFAVYADGNRDELAQGKIRITPNPAAETVADPRSENEKILHAIRCLIKGRANSDVTMYKIGNREVTKMTMTDLLKFEAQYATRVRKERIRRGEKVPTKSIGVTFGDRGQQ